MPKQSFLVTLTFCILGCVLAQAVTASHDIIPAGTLLQCTLDEPNFSSKTALVGDPVLCHLGAINSFGHPAFPRGAMLGGHLEDYKNPGRFVGKGWIQLEFDRLVLPGEVLPLSAKIIASPHMKVDAQGDIHGKGHPKRDTLGWMIPVLWPIKIITLPARGPYPTLKGESRISLRLMDDVEVPFPVAENSVPKPPWATPSSYHASLYEPTLNQPATVQPAAYIQRAKPTPPLALPDETLPQMTVIALKGGTALLARQYWVQDGQLRCVSAGDEQRAFSLEKIDLTETVLVNRERNIDFVLQSRDAAEQ
jgi:hypothetical protein